MDPEQSREPETLAQAEARKKALDEAAAEQSHRAGGEEEARHQGPEPEWRPPKELAGGSGHVLLRFIVFVAIVVGIYFLVQRGSRAAFQPELVALDVAAPQVRIPPNSAITLSVRVANTTTVPGTAFLVAALPSGEEVTGTPVEVQGNDTANVDVDIRLPVGDHVVSVVAFQAGREEDTRLQTYSGLNVWVGDREVQLSEVTLPDTLLATDTLVVDFTATNPGTNQENIVPVFVFGSSDGTLTEVDGPLAEIGPGETGPLQITVVGANLDPGLYSVRLLARTPTGERLAVERVSTAVEVKSP